MKTVTNKNDSEGSKMKGNGGINLDEKHYHNVSTSRVHPDPSMSAIPAYVMVPPPLAEDSRLPVAVVPVPVMSKPVIASVETDPEALSWVSRFQAK